jgi:hypothetical protein
MPLSGGTFTGAVTFGGTAGDIAGIGTATFTLGATGQIGTGASVACANFSICDSHSGTWVLNTGTGTLTSGIDFTVNLPGSVSANKNCSWNFFSIASNTFLNPQAFAGNVSGPTLQYSTGVALTASQTYYGDYVCGGI